MADDKVRASSSSSSLFTLNLPNGLGGGEREQIGRVAEKHVSHRRTNRRGKNPGSNPRQEGGEMGGGWERDGRGQAKPEASLERESRRTMPLRWLESDLHLCWDFLLSRRREDVASDQQHLYIKILYTYT